MSVARDGHTGRSWRLNPAGRGIFCNPLTAYIGKIVLFPPLSYLDAPRRAFYCAISEQMQHEHAAGTNRELLASVNQGRPPIAATPKSAEFRGRGVIAANRAGAPYRVPE